MKTNVLGVQYDNVTMAEALDTARALLQRPEASYCVTPNAEMAYEALHDESFRAILNEASLVLPDGAGHSFTIFTDGVYLSECGTLQ